VEGRERDCQWERSPDLRAPPPPAVCSLQAAVGRLTPLGKPEHRARHFGGRHSLSGTQRRTRSQSRPLASLPLTISNKWGTSSSTLGAKQASRRASEQVLLLVCCANNAPPSDTRPDARRRLWGAQQNKCTTHCTQCTRCAEREPANLQGRTCSQRTNERTNEE